MQELLTKIQNAHHFLSYLPFFGLMAGQSNGSTPIITKLLEAAVMSLVTSAIGVYVAVEVLKSDLNYLKSYATETNSKVEKVDAKVEQLRRDLYVPRYGVGGGAGS